jgi:hypothetical protein
VGKGKLLGYTRIHVCIIVIHIKLSFSDSHRNSTYEICSWRSHVWISNGNWEIAARNFNVSLQQLMVAASIIVCTRPDIISYKQNEGQLNKCVELHLLQFSTRNGIFTFSLEAVEWPNHSKWFGHSTLSKHTVRDIQTFSLKAYAEQTTMEMQKNDIERDLKQDVRKWAEFIWVRIICSSWGLQQTR